MMGFNEKRYPFMDEGFTTIFTERFLSDIYHDIYISEEAGRASLVDDYNFLVLNDDSPMFKAYAQLNMFNTTYQYYVKPPVAFLLFEEMVGEKKFLKGFHEFVKRWRGKHPTPWDLFYTMNDVLGENYNWFWKSWFFDLGYPDLGLELEEDYVVVKRVGAGSLPLPVKLNIEMVDGSTSTIERPMSIWKDGSKEIRIKINKLIKVRSIA